MIDRIRPQAAFRASEKFDGERQLFVALAIGNPTDRWLTIPIFSS
jgi:hypothetical protein